MARERYTTEEIIRKLREGDVLIGQGRTVADVIGHVGRQMSPTIAGARSMAV